MKKIIYKKTLMATVVALFPILMASCVKYPQADWIMEVIDKKTDVDHWKLDYDYKGRLTQYGNTPITYGRNSVTIGMMQGDESDNAMCSATFELSGNRACRSESYSLQLVDSVPTRICKRTDYEWIGDTLKMSSAYQSVKGKNLLRKVIARYVYDTDNRLIEVLTSSLNDCDEELSACHSYFNYENNIHYMANLNLQAYFADREDWDTFFFFLLDMSGRVKSTALPNRIRHCVNHGKATYIAESLYRLDGEYPVLMEVISDKIQLKARYEFEYYH